MRYVTFFSKNQCVEHRASMFPNYLLQHADSFLDSNGRHGFIRVIHVDDDYSHGLLYFCVDLVGDNSCLPGSGRLGFISRTDSISNSKIKEIERAVAMPCLRDDQIDWNSHERSKLTLTNQAYM